VHDKLSRSITRRVVEKGSVEPNVKGKRSREGFRLFAKKLNGYCSRAAALKERGAKEGFVYPEGRLKGYCNRASKEDIYTLCILMIIAFVP
jgi:hypothetical protein